MQLCIYCGENEALTADHVPPRGLFPKPRPSNLVTVPCCEPCRQGQSLDDEYFIRALVIRHDVDTNSAAQKVLEGVRRALSKPTKRGFTRDLLNSVKPVELFTFGGVYSGETMSYEIDLRRLNRVIERTTLGLYYRLFETRLPESHCCVSYAASGIDVAESEVRQRLQRVVDFAVNGKVGVLGENVFAYCVNEVEKHSTVWLHLFYGRAAFLALTYPENWALEGEA